jgi:cell division protein ZapA
MAGAEVYILGQKYTIKGNAPEEQIHRLEEQINRQIAVVLEKFPNIPPTKALILTLFNMVEELEQLKEREGLTKDIEKKAEMLVDLFE